MEGLRWLSDEEKERLNDARFKGKNCAQPRRQRSATPPFTSHSRLDSLSEWELVWDHLDPDQTFWNLRSWGGDGPTLTNQERLFRLSVTSHAPSDRRPPSSIVSHIALLGISVPFRRAFTQRRQETPQNLKVKIFVSNYLPSYMRAVGGASRAKSLTKHVLFSAGQKKQRNLLQSPEGQIESLQKPPQNMRAHELLMNIPVLSMLLKGRNDCWPLCNACAIRYLLYNLVGPFLHRNAIVRKGRNSSLPEIVARLMISFVTGVSSKE
ncbi:uncharacterized protein CLUP02_01062 [Colletotrichum lupini]|uniref:Uncharacterized protein n=1 Tax=Colletotrichum lupini TaxID=145971 RepID=A0A9Q8SCI3_9PEZI|nr:uncharacterized protein CLUP02_01062 [Colletotrichum lupini]UQC74411.1 hypothetical protein CLUP02_01062 [Colletotrichum lupini]